ncbi:MAG: ribosomal L7Ae/L30e/S12e/Gadd45 family protein [Nitrospirae bacterium]|nr:ribosomal L7Ae/L30e/S12e/Gadd45 family protein [Nitrospirota bacterium]
MAGEGKIDTKALCALIEKVATSGNGKITKGINEVTKAVERGSAKLVVVAGDVDPKELVMHIPIICKEKGITYFELPSKMELGKVAKLPVSCSSLAVIEFGEFADEAKKVLN